VWSQAYGGGEGDWGYSVQQTTDGGYIMAGYTLTFGAGSYDVWLIKTDAEGNEMWSKTYGGSSWDYGNSIEQTSDGGYIITGYTGTYGAGGSDVWVIKTDAAGNEEWDQTFGGSGDDFGYGIQQTSDGAYILAAQTASYGAGLGDAWLIKIDSDGNEVWNQTFGGSADDLGSYVQQTSDGGYILTGYTGSYGAGNWDVWLIKTDDEGNEVWDLTYGGSNLDRGYQVQQTTDGGYVITGWTQSFGAGSFDVLLLKTDSEITGIDNSGANINKSVYPNPVHSQISIELSNALMEEASEIRITNLMGETQMLLQFDNHMDVNSLENGIYLLNILNKEGKIIMIKKIIKH